MIICITGAQGTGKTTLLEKLKTHPAFENFLFKKSFTRKLKKEGFKINKDGNDDTQLAIMNGHVQALEDEGNLVLDRCAIDGYVYTYYLYQEGQVSEDTLDIATQDLYKCLDKYDYIFYLKPSFKLIKDEDRLEDSDYLNSISEIFDQVISTIDSKVIEIKDVDLEKRVNKIVKTIL